MSGLGLFRIRVQSEYDDRGFYRTRVSLESGEGGFLGDLDVEDVVATGGMWHQAVWRAVNDMLQQIRDA